MADFDLPALQKLGVYNEHHLAKMSEPVVVVCMQIFDCHGQEQRFTVYHLDAESTTFLT